ncbi:MAG: hypothetical protein ABI165_17615 [Bryobacteraceae bacterium]
MLLLLLAVIILDTTVPAQTRDVQYQADLAPRNIMATFDRGYLIVYDRDETLDVYARDGARLYSVSAKAPAASSTRMLNAAVDEDGTLAVTVDYTRPNHTGGGIALFDRTGAQIRFFDTGEYLPGQICYAPDHSIWTLGHPVIRTDNVSKDYKILRNYSQDGRELGAFLSRSSFATSNRAELGGPMIGGWLLRVANGRVGAQIDQRRWWVETGLNGKEIGRWNIGSGGHLGFTQDGNLYGQNNHDGSIRVFDRSTGVWRPLSTPMPDGYLLGADGNNLVFEMKGGSILRWVPAP